MRRNLLAIGLVSVVGCNVLPAFITIPSNMQVVPGGITDTRPFFGRVVSADNPGVEVGDFLLATCGCGDWRALVQPDDDSPRGQWAVRYYTDVEYDEMISLLVYGTEEEKSLSGTVDQTSGESSGKIELLGRRLRYNAVRGEQHTDEVRACQLCHLGEDPIYPRPDDHPPVFDDCLRCHSVIIN